VAFESHVGSREFHTVMAGAGNERSPRVERRVTGADTVVSGLQAMLTVAACAQPFLSLHGNGIGQPATSIKAA